MKKEKLLSLAAAQAVLFCLFFAACAGKTADRAETPSGGPESGSLTQSEAGQAGNIEADLGRIAEIERAGAFFPGLALAESGIREKAGDLCGAAVAAYKELAWAYGYGSAGKSQVEDGLRNALFGMEGSRLNAAEALKGCIAFAREEWALAEELLYPILADDEEPDSFLRWMLLVCGLEAGAKDPDEFQAARSAYGAIRARYAFFPEYWYRGARAFMAGDGSIASSYAEQCINASSDGPFSAPCRKIIADNLGLPSSTIAPDVGEMYAGLRTRAEIEKTIRFSVSMNDPAVLQELFPLMALPENPYTVYALGALKSLSAVPEYRGFFRDEAQKTNGRLAERLNYVSRG